MRIKTIITVALVAAAVGLGGCFGGDTEVKQTSVSKGQELQDLKKALDSGAITEREYDRLRKEIMAR
jgi:Short C-terminal domain